MTLNMFYVYVLTNERKKIYIGHTSNLEERLKHHNGALKNKQTSFTWKNKAGLWQVIYQESFITRGEAMKREKQLKSSRGRDFIKNKIMRP